MQPVASHERDKTFLVAGMRLAMLFTQSTNHSKLLTLALHVICLKRHQEGDNIYVRMKVSTT